MDLTEQAKKLFEEMDKGQLSVCQQMISSIEEPDQLESLKREILKKVERLKVITADIKTDDWDSMVAGFKEVHQAFGEVAEMICGYSSRVEEREVFEYAQGLKAQGIEFEAIRIKGHEFHCRNGSVCRGSDIPF